MRLPLCWIVPMPGSLPSESALLTQNTRTGGSEDPPPGKSEDHPLRVNVVFTTQAGTLAALRTVSRLGAHLGVHPRVLILYAVPFTLPLEDRAVPEGFLEARVRALRRGSPTEISARTYLCRDPQWSLRQMLQPHSLIIMGGRMGWWPTREQRLARALVKDGHEVIFVGVG